MNFMAFIEKQKKRGVFADFFWRKGSTIKAIIEITSETVCRKLLKVCICFIAVFFEKRKSIKKSPKLNSAKSKYKQRMIQYKGYNLDKEEAWLSLICSEKEKIFFKLFEIGWIT